MSKNKNFSLFRKGCRLEGELDLGGSTHVDCEFHGNIHTQGELLVGPDAVIHGEIHAQRAVIHGHVVGHILATQSVLLHASARVQGDVVAPVLQSEEGANLNGRIRTAKTTGISSEGLRSKLHFLAF